MKTKYSIIVPVYNEKKHVDSLLLGLKPYYDKDHEIIIINDGSDDGSLELLRKSKFIKLHSFSKNRGKGTAIKRGLKSAINEKVIIFDSDLELDPNQIELLMILNEDRDIRCVFANRYSEKLYKSFWDYGNYLVSNIFNIINKSNVKDPLCCAKSFFIKDLDIRNLSSSKFDIDVELTLKLLKFNDRYLNVDIEYRRRNRKQGKKLKIIGFYINFKTYFKKLRIEIISFICID